MKSRFFLPFLFLTLLHILSSCQLDTLKKIPAVINSHGKTICVVPLAVDVADQKIFHFESQTGLRISKKTSDLIRQNSSEVMIKDPQIIVGDIKNSYLSEPDWGEICRYHKLDFLVIATLKQFQLSDKRNQGFLRGRAAFEVKVIDQNNQLLYAGRRNNIFYPKPMSPDQNFDIPGQHIFNLSPENVRVGLENQVATILARLFYSYKKEER